MNVTDNIQIFNEDCIDTMARLPDRAVDIVITSPPYNIGSNRIVGNYKKGTLRSLSYDSIKDSLTKEQYFEQTAQWIRELIRITKYHIFWNVNEVSGNQGIVQFLYGEFGHMIKDTFIWAKPNAAPMIHPTTPTNGFEYIFCISHDKPDSKSYSHCNFSNHESGTYVSTAIIRKTNRPKSFHSFTFPQLIPEFFIEYFSKPGDLVYDPFMGSGTTALACHKAKRKCIGSEISTEYYEKMIKRIKERTAQLRMF